MRQYALSWLRADLSARSDLLEKDKDQSTTRNALRRRLRRWQWETAFAGVRDADALTKFPEAERNDWQLFWADIDALLKRIDTAGRKKKLLARVLRHES